MKYLDRGMLNHKAHARVARPFYEDLPEKIVYWNFI